MRQLLSSHEIAKLIELLRDEFAHLESLRRTQPLAAYIQFPKIPSILTESIAERALTKGLVAERLKRAIVRPGGRVADLLVSIDGRELRVEVKATGASAFQNLGKKDIAADYLLWLDFGNYFANPQRTSITIVIWEQPRERFHRECKITLGDAKKQAPDYRELLIDPLRL